jgi:predicted DNA-binding WGR domain protein
MLRYYAMQVMPNLFGEWGLLRVWGRIGRSGQLRVDWFATQQEAVRALQTLEQAKRKRGYRGKLIGDAI